jgi:hypothetical protein
MVSLTSPEDVEHEDRRTRILEAAKRADDTFHILFIHTDGGGDEDRARRERITPAVEAIAGTLEGGVDRTVAVVPVREMEAWALADGDALRAAFGTHLSNAQLGIPTRPQDVEALADPKQTLEMALAAAVGGGRRRKKLASDFLEAIGERAKLTELRQVPAFKIVEADLEKALRNLGFLSR